MRSLAVLVSGAALASAKQNPIRKVVTLMQEMQAEIEAEVKKEQEMFEKFECYCKKNTGDLEQKAQEAQALIEATRAEVESAAGMVKQLAEEIKTHKKDRAEAEKNLADSTKKRHEEKAQYDKDLAEQQQTTEDIKKAIAALQKGLGKSFLQTDAASYLGHILQSHEEVLKGLNVLDQTAVSSFLQSGTGSSGEIIGILKVMQENFEKSVAELIETEAEAAKGYEKLRANLEDLIKTSGASIEKKSETKGQTMVALAEGKNKVATTETQLSDDMAALGALKTSCADKGTEFSTRQKDAAAEIDAIGQAIGVLNNDDALDLFHKTDTSTMQVSLLQADMRTNSPVASAVKILSQKFTDAAVSMLAYSAKQALRSGEGKVDFSSIIKMVDDMVVLLKKEAKDDLDVRDNCTVSFNETAAGKKETQRAIDGLQADIEKLDGVIEAEKAVIAKNVDEIATAEKSMADATAQRTNENGEFVVTMRMNTEAITLIEKAKNKLNKFYNPDLYKNPPKELGGDEEFVQQPAPAPEMWEEGARKTKGQKSNSVMALMDMIIKDLDADSAAVEHAETTAQADYERLAQDLTDLVRASNKAVAEATASKANAEEARANAKDSLSMKNEELTGIHQTITDLHGKCDFILSAFEERKAARETEIEGLTKAKAVLHGAKFD